MKRELVIVIGGLIVGAGIAYVIKPKSEPLVWQYKVAPSVPSTPAQEESWFSKVIRYHVQLFNNMFTNPDAPINPP